MTDNMTGIASALAVYKDIIALKNMLINKLNKVDTIQTLLRTDKGYEVVNLEGFVAIGTENGAVKLVDPMEFSKNNVTQLRIGAKGEAKRVHERQRLDEKRRFLLLLGALGFLQVHYTSNWIQKS